MAPLKLGSPHFSFTALFFRNKPDMKVILRIGPSLYPFKMLNFNRKVKRTKMPGTCLKETQKADV
jgi:hypothetical protein